MSTEKRPDQGQESSEGASASEATTRLSKDAIKKVKDQMSVELPTIVEDVQKKIKSQLLSRWAILAAIIPVLGFLSGFALETWLLSTLREQQAKAHQNEIDKLTVEARNDIASSVASAQQRIDSLSKDAKVQIDAAVDSGRVAVVQLQNDSSRFRSEADEALIDVKATKRALDSVLRDTALGDLTKVQEKLGEQSAKVEKLRSTLAELDKRISLDIPDGIAELRDDVAVAERTRKAVLELEEFFGKKETSQQARALAEAFYRIYELSISEAEISLLAPSNLNKEEVKLLPDAASQITCVIELRDSKFSGKDEHVLRWTVKALGIITEKVSNAKFGSEYPEYRIKLSIKELNDVPDWWKVGKDMKRIGIRHIDSFDLMTIKLEYGMMTTRETKSVLQSAKFSLNKVCLEAVKLKMHINREEVQLVFDNATKMGDETILSNAVGAVGEHLADEKGVTFALPASQLFQRTTAEYIRSLSRAPSDQPAPPLLSGE